MRLGIIGLPKSGKTTVFDAIVGPHKESHTPPHAAVQNIAVVRVPDERLNLLRNIFPEKKTTPATLELLELRGIFPSPWEVRTDAASSIALLREMDEIIEVVRVFKDDTVPHPKGSVNHERDLKDIDQELILNDLLLVDKRIEKLEKPITHSRTKQSDKEELDVLRQCKDALEKSKEIIDVNLTPEQKRLIRGFCLLTEKPRIVVENVGEDLLGKTVKSPPSNTREVLSFCAKLEQEMWYLAETEREGFQKEWGIVEPASDRLLKACWSTLDLVSFFSIEGEEMRVWPLPKGQTALDAAGKIHTDIARGFIKAEVINYIDLTDLGSIKEAKTHGKLHLVGKDYIVRDGDIITFRFHV